MKNRLELLVYGGSRNRHLKTTRRLSMPGNSPAGAFPLAC